MNNKARVHLLSIHFVPSVFDVVPFTLWQASFYLSEGDEDEEMLINERPAAAKTGPKSGQ